MSVLVSKREMSNTEYLRTLRILEVTVIQRSRKKPRELDGLFLFDFIKYAKDAFNYAVAAHTFPISNKEDVLQQQKYFKLSLISINLFNAQLGIYYDLYRYEEKGLSSAEMQTLSNLAYNASTQLSSAMVIYKKRYKQFNFNDIETEQVKIDEN